MTPKVITTCMAAVLLSAASSLSAQTLRVDPPGWTTQGPVETVDFGTVMVGQSVSMTFRLISDGPTWIAISGAELRDNTHLAFAITSAPDPFPPEVAPGDWIEIELTFTPLLPGRHEATLRIESNDRYARYIDGPLTATAIPEPAMLTLLGLGSLLLIRRRQPCQASPTSP